MRAAAEILLLEAEALRSVLDAAAAESFDNPTVCDGWSVRDVLAHCGAALSLTASGDLHDFTPAENEADVEARRGWPLQAVLDELFTGYAAAADAIDRAGGALDGIGLGEWIHGGDVREALGAGDAYTSAGADLAVELLIQRSVRHGRPCIVVDLGTQRHWFGAGSEVGRLSTDLETFVRLCGGRRPDPARYELVGVAPADLVLFD